MVSRKYNNYKFLYKKDNGDEIIRIQRAYKAPDGVLYTPITPLFESKVISTRDKVDEKINNERHVLSFVRVEDNPNQDYGEFKTIIPYNPIEENHSLHINEILNADKVICGDYKGEDQYYV